MIRVLLIIFLSLIISNSIASDQKDIIQYLKRINNFSFNFEQNINGKLENGNCIIQYPKKIHCKYNLKNKKILVSNGRYLVIKTNKNHYIYPLKKTALNLILDKNFLLNKIKTAEKRNVDDKFINYTFSENDNEINIFFNKDNHKLVGWQTTDIYQNMNITFISSVVENIEIEKNLFKLPIQN